MNVIIVGVLKFPDGEEVTIHVDGDYERYSTSQAAAYISERNTIIKSKEVKEEIK